MFIIGCGLKVLFIEVYFHIPTYVIFYNYKLLTIIIPKMLLNMYCKLPLYEKCWLVIFRRTSKYDVVGLVLRDVKTEYKLLYIVGKIN